MKEKISKKYFSVFLYIGAAGFLCWYLYCGIASASPFLRAGLLFATCVFIYLGTYTGTKKTDAETAKKRMKISFAFMFVLYLTMLVTFLFFESYFGRDSAQFEGAWTKERFLEYLETSANFIPFKTIKMYIRYYDMPGIRSFSNLFGNIFIFVPE